MQRADVIILCGGKGTRAYPDTLELPKPLLSVGDTPIVEHVMGIYAAQGHTRFILAAGYLGEMLAHRYADPPEGMDVEVVDTGDDTDTGERIRLASEAVTTPQFFATYADGVGDIDLTALLDLHCSRGALATVTTVPLPSQYGTLVADDEGRVTDFREKPRLEDHWINAGFFAFDQRVFDRWEGKNLESEVLPALARDGVLYSHRHRGFWKSMDTFKDRQELSALAGSGRPPWAVASRQEETR